MNRGVRAKLLVAAFSLTLIQFNPLTAHSGVVFHSSQAAWLADTASVETFLTTSANVATADEVASPPSVNAQLATNVLTFQAINTGLSRDFTITALQSGANFTFDDDEVAGNIPNFDDALSVGDIANHENDDWDIEFSGLLPTAFAFELRDSHDGTGESLSVFGVGDVLLGTLSVIPETVGSDFIGVIAMNPIARISFDEDPGDDDIAIANFQFGEAVVPEPSTYALALAGLLGITIIRRKRTN